MFVSAWDIASAATGKEARVFSMLSAPAEEDDLSVEVVSVEIGGIVRNLSAGIIRMLKAFNRTVVERGPFSHDCGVFALACQTGETYDGIAFYGENGLRPRAVLHDRRFVVALGDKAVEAGLIQGDVIKTMQVDAAGKEVLRSHHYMVR